MTLFIPAIQMFHIIQCNYKRIKSKYTLSSLNYKRKKKHSGSSWYMKIIIYNRGGNIHSTASHHPVHDYFPRTACLQVFYAKYGMYEVFATSKTNLQNERISPHLDVWTSKALSTCWSITDWLSRDSCVGGSGFCGTGSSESDSQSGAMVTLGKPGTKPHTT